jgi:hypothetical protein
MIRTKKNGLVLLLLTCLVMIACTERTGMDYQERVYYGAKSEPVSRVIHGAGQSDGAFDKYISALDSTTLPLIYMIYGGLRYTEWSSWTAIQQKKISRFNWGVIPQLGLSMTHDGMPEEHYEHQVAAGKYDKETEAMVKALAAFETPVFLRIGYEFNGPWNGYQPETYKQAFIRIATCLKKYDAHNVATVWCFCPDPRTPDFMAYYPGDEYVDWWGIDFFSTEHFTEPSAVNFLDSAYKHQKPVMIGESTPRFVGVHKGDSSWNEWYRPFFNIIRQHPHIKAFCYINWDWSRYKQWHNWGDARIEENETVRKKYLREMQSPLYLHGNPHQNITEILQK